MIRNNPPIQKINQAEKNLENIKETIKGLFDILDINFADTDFYLKTGRENLIALYQNLLELLLNDFGLRYIRNKLYSSDSIFKIELDKEYQFKIKDRISYIQEK